MAEGVPMSAWLDWFFGPESKAPPAMGDARDFGPPQDPAIRCRHRRGDCPRCGTSERRDRLHSTRDGRGVVARIRRDR